MPMLKKLMVKQIAFNDPATNKRVQGVVGDVIVWRLIMNALQGDIQAIREICDRV